MKNKPLTQLFETTICSIHESVKDRCRVKMKDVFCANCYTIERNSVCNCIDFKLINSYITKYCGHLPDIENFE